MVRARVMVRVMLTSAAGVHRVTLDGDDMITAEETLMVLSTSKPASSPLTSVGKVVQQAVSRS